MAVAVSYPGVYIQEVPSGSRAIAGVPTSVAAFVGFTARGPVNEPAQLFSFADFERRFGGLNLASELGYAISHFFLNGGATAWVVRVASGAASASVAMETPGGTLTLTATATSEGLWGNALVIGVDHATANPASLFNLTVTEMVERNGRLTPARSETHRNLSMNAFAATYAVDAVNAASDLIALTNEGATVTGRGKSRSTTLTDAVAASLNDDRRRLAISLDGGPFYEFDLFDAGGSLANLAAIATAIQTQVRLLEPGNSAFDDFEADIDASQIRARSGTADDQVSAVAFAPRLDAQRRGGADPRTRQRRARDRRRRLGAPGPDRHHRRADRRLRGNRLQRSRADGDHRQRRGRHRDRHAKPHAPGHRRRDPGRRAGLTRRGADPDRGCAQGEPARRVRPRTGRRRRRRAGGDAGRDRLLEPLRRHRHRRRRAARLRGAGRGGERRRLSAGGRAVSLAQVAGTPGNDGGPPSALEVLGVRAAKTGIFALEDVDLFNILNLPGISDIGVLSNAIAYAEERRSMILIDMPATVDDFDERARLDRRPGARRRAAPPQRSDLLPARAARRPAAGQPAAQLRQRWRRRRALRPHRRAARGLEGAGRDRGAADRRAGARLRAVRPGERRAESARAQRLAQLPGLRPVAWGARTMRGADALTDEWKYVPVRRIALFIEESLYRGTQFVVFEPNDEPLWAQIRLSIGSFMNNLFRQGAFQGKTPQEAYLVRCDSTTTTQADIDLGIVNIIVGFAPLKPAEFVIIHIQQLAGQSQA